MSPTSHSPSNPFFSDFHCQLVKPYRGICCLSLQCYAFFSFIKTIPFRQQERLTNSPILGQNKQAYFNLLLSRVISETSTVSPLSSYFCSNQPPWKSPTPLRVEFTPLGLLFGWVSRQWQFNQSNHLNACKTWSTYNAAFLKSATGLASERRVWRVQQEGNGK